MADPLADLDDLLEELDRSAKPAQRDSLPPPISDSRPQSTAYPRQPISGNWSSLAVNLPPPPAEDYSLPPSSSHHTLETNTYAPPPAAAPVAAAAPKASGGSDAWKNELDDLLSELSVSSAPPPAAAPVNAYVPRSQQAAPAPYSAAPAPYSAAPVPYTAAPAPYNTTSPSYTPPQSSYVPPQTSYNQPAYGAPYQPPQQATYTAPRPVTSARAPVPAPVVVNLGPAIPIEYSAGHPVTLTAEEQNLIQELNRARTNPYGYAEVLEKERRPYFNGKHLKLPGTNVLLVTEEGVAAVDDAIAFLRAQQPLPPFKISPGMVSAAKEALAEVGPTGDTSCESIRKFDNFGRFEQEAVEIASFGTSEAREIVVRFVVCDGQPDRVQRTYIFEPIYSCIGLAVGEHRSAYKTMACINFTKAFHPK